MNTLIIEKLEALAKELDIKPQPNPFVFHGMPLYEVKPNVIPVLQVREDFKWLTDEARAKINGYLLDRFGVREECAVPKNQVLLFGNNILMRPEQMSIIRTLDTWA